MVTLLLKNLASSHSCFPSPCFSINPMQLLLMCTHGCRQYSLLMQQLFPHDSAAMCAAALKGLTACRSGTKGTELPKYNTRLT